MVVIVKKCLSLTLKFKPSILDVFDLHFEFTNSEEMSSVDAIIELDTLSQWLGVQTAAAKACLDSRALGYSDWRLPTQQELSGLYNSHTALTGWTSAFTWSSTAGGGGHYDVDLNVGGVGWGDDNYPFYVSCVH